MPSRRLIHTLADLLALADRRQLLLGAVLSVVTVLAGMALLGLSGWFITATALAGLIPATALAFDVFAPAAAIRLLAIGRTGSRYGERLVTHDATLSLLAHLRARLFRGFARPAAARDLLARPARLLFRLTNDIDALDGLYLRLMVPFSAAFGATLAAGTALGLLAPWLGLGLALFLGGIGILVPVATALAGRRPARRRAHGLEALRARTIDLVDGQTELAMAGRLAAQRDAVRRADAYLADADDRLNRIETGAGLAFGIAGSLALALVLAGAGLLVEAGRIDTPLAAFALLIAVAVMEPFGALRRGAAEIGRTLLALDRLGPRIRDGAEMPVPARPDGSTAVLLDNVDFAHEGVARPVFTALDLRIEAGETVALIGPSGAGKSSLLALIAGEATPRSGRCAVRPTALLTQRSELFRDTLAENLRLAAPDADEARLWAALTAAGLAGDVGEMADGLETRLGDGGLGLSGGQGRRLALARMFLRNAPVWLLDEPTEGLDRETAVDVLARVRAAAAGHTLLLATHLRREAAIADRLLMVGGGGISREARRGEPAFEEMLAGLRAG
ncbi:ATP-binding cassette domain-containing protein [Zavarzinia compransoris]|uniref:amino acid ABC transporter ATP-binding/permease protein n=1 Tax=Zavarzinia marina TaxID=2911065 RepID=UPI001F186F5D|nr:ATP-binding cassette domain-containing protein [Zavarzinia marina]MCF4165893.1 ATP-binding cassette domain-containing protein [Zavarzinia marina]